MERKRSRKIWWLVGVSFSIVLFAAYLLGTVSSIALNRELAGAQAAGFPVEPEDLYLDPAPTDEDNAALVFEQMAEVPTPDGDDYWHQTQHYDALFAGYDDFDRELARGYMDAKSELLLLAERAAVLPQYRPDKDWSNPVAVVLPEFSIANKVTRALVARAMLSMEDGDVRSALDDLHKVLLISNHMDDSGPLIGHLVAFAARGHYSAAVERMVTFPEADVAFLQGVLSQLEDWPTSTDWTQTLRFEAYYCVWIPQHLDKADDQGYNVSWDWEDGLPDDPRDWARVSWRLPKTRIDAARLSLEHWIEVLDTYDPNSNDPTSWARGIAVRMPTGTGFWHGSEALATEHVYPMESAIGSGIRDSARREVLKSSLTVLLAMRHTSSDPFEEIGIDPWTGTSMLFKETKDGFMIYSVGQNRSDDGGERQRDKDTVFEYPIKRSSAPPDYYSN